MRYFTLNKLWELRAELDKAIIDNDCDVIQGIGDKYQNLVKDERWFSRAFVCYNHAFWNEGQRSRHNYANINAIARNIEDYGRKYLDGEDISVKFKSQYGTPFLAGEIWILRAMYDKFLMDAENCQEELVTQQNMILGKAVIDRLHELLHMEQTEGYSDQLLLILQEVREGYASRYGKRNPKIDYSQLREDFLEK